MSSDCVDNMMSAAAIDGGNDGNKWDFLCPQYCDLTATESTDQLTSIDQFFHIRHDNDDNDGVSDDPLMVNNNNRQQVDDLKINDNYSTPPQNKENMDEEEEDNEIFYSTKKYFSGGGGNHKKLSYKLRSTPMRLLQYNGNTPLKETRISLSSKKKNKKQIVNNSVKVVVEEELHKTADDGDEECVTVFKMNQLVESLPNTPKAVNNIDLVNAGDDNDDEEEHVVNIDLNDQTYYEEKVGLNEENNDDINDDRQTNDEQVVLINAQNDDNDDNVFVNGNSAPIDEQSAANLTITGRESYTISKIPESLVKPKSAMKKSVTLISPEESAKNWSTRRRSSVVKQRKATPLKISSTKKSTTPVLSKTSMSGSRRKASISSVFSRLYSTGKKREDNYRTVAEQLRDFETKMRSCDRPSRPTEHRNTGGCGSRSSSLTSLTMPKSPKFSTVSRHRQPARPTEDIIASQIKKYTFKANPIRKKLFDSRFASGIPRVRSTKEPTKAVDLHFSTVRRNEVRAAKANDLERAAKAVENIKPFAFKANPMPDFTKKSAPIAVPKTAGEKKKTTTFKPFSFDDRIQALVQKKRTISVEQ